MSKPSKSKEAKASQIRWVKTFKFTLVDLTKSLKTMAQIKFDSEGNMIREGKAYAYALKHFPHLLEKYEGNKS